MRVPVYVDPSDQSMAVLDPSRSWSSFIPLVFGVLLLGAGLIGWIALRSGLVATVGVLPVAAAGGLQRVSDPTPKDKVLSVNPQRRTRYYGEVRVREVAGQRLQISAITGIQAKLYAVSNDFAGMWWVRWVYRLRGLTVLPASSSHGVVTDAPEWVALMMSRTGFAQHTQWMRDVYAPSKPLGIFYVLVGKGHFGSPAQLTPSFVGQLLSRMEPVLREAEAVPTQ